MILVIDTKNIYNNNTNYMNAIQIASYLVKRYYEEIKEQITEMKLHKLLYFTQRESFIQLGEPMFNDKFQAWRYGPVMVQVRDLFKNGQLSRIPSDEELAPYQSVFDTVMKEYAPKDTWSLSDMTHAESSWKNARCGLNPSDKCSHEMDTEDIRKDAFKISKDLKDTMSELRCERLTFHTENKNYVQSFVNKRNPQLPKFLKKTGWKEDESGTCDYYIIKDTQNNILFFFALRAGLVQDLYDQERIDACKTIYPLLVEFFNVETSPERKRELNKQILPIWKEYELTTDLIISAQKNIEKKKLLDRIQDTNKNTTLVWQTHSAIELAFFCQNSDCKELITQLGFKRHFGSAVFWYYIMPKILKAQKYIGCEYVYLFAADEKNRGKLMEYYNTNLHFEQTIFINGIKPMQDNNCFFMCQKVSELHIYQIDYLSNFSFTNNPDINM